MTDQSAIDIASPLALPCGAVLGNRLCKTAMTEGLADPRNCATEALTHLYGRWSESGAALLLSGNIQVDRRHLERPGNVVIDHNGGLDALRELALAGTRAGNHFWMQINHPGKQTSAFLSTYNGSPKAPSALARADGNMRFTPQAMGEDDIARVVEGFSRVSLTAREAGFTGVQIHSAHGYLLSQFLSPNHNQRSDRWGGGLEGRARLLLDVVRATRSAVGPDFPISVKLNSADFQQGGFDEKEALAVACWLDRAGIDLLELTGGRLESRQQDVQRDSTIAREAYFSDFSRDIRAAVSMPVMLTGGFRSRPAMDAALQRGEADMIGLGRPFCLEPDFARKLLELDGYRSMLVSVGEHGKQGSAGINSIDEASYYCMQIIALARGENADIGMTAEDARSLFHRNEERAAAAII